MDLSTDYNNVDFIPDGASYPEKWATEAMDWRRMEHDIGRARLNQPYGRKERQKFDLFLPAGPAKGLVVFVHGGYWLRFGREDWSHFASGATASGWAVAMPSYTRAPQARVPQITTEIAEAITVVSRVVPGPVRLAGHSAGGHLVTRMVEANSPLPESILERIEHVLAISPVTDLRPLLQTAMNKDLGLDMAVAEAESPVLRHPQKDLPVTVWVGAEERPVFLDQARWLAEAWNCEHHIAAGRHHFDVIDPLRDPESSMVQTLLKA